MLSDFATSAFPLRASRVPAFMRCPWREVSMFLAGHPDESSAAADTGSALHAAVAAWHTNGHEAKKALAQMEERVGEFPLADFHEAALHFAPYIADPRNRTAIVEACEERVEFELEGVFFRGTLDQVRRVGSGYEVWDVKTGKSMGGGEMLDYYIYQQIVYVHGASLKLGVPCVAGGLLATYDYRRRPPRNPFWRYEGLTAQVCAKMLEAVVDRVKDVRAGRVHVGPGVDCKWCQHVSVGRCVDALLRV